MDSQTKPITNTPPAPALTIPPEIHAFLDGLLTDAGMTTLDDDTREEMIKELFVRLDHYITTVIIEKLPPENLDEFMKLNEEKKPMSEIQKYLMAKMPNTEEVFATAFADFRDLYLGNVTTVRDVAQDTPSQNLSAKSDKVN